MKYTLAALTILMPIAPLQGNDLATRLTPLLQQHEGEVAVMVRHLENGSEFAWREHAVQPTASLIKLAVMVAAYQQADAGALDLDAMITLQETDKVPGSGILTPHFSAGAAISLRDAIRLMIACSDNTATNLVIDRLGIRTTAESMKALGFSETRLHSKVYRRDTSAFPERSRKYGLGSTTARETVQLLEQIFHKQVASPAACEEMLDHLFACDDDSKLGRDLPQGVRLAHKTGSLNATRCDAGILLTPGGPVAVCVLTTENADTSWGPGNAAHRLCGQIGRAVVESFSPAQPKKERRTKPLQIGTNGLLVEMLQRTLNARLQPSPELSVDGDFGPATAAAVRRFESSRGIPADGIADEAVLTALGPLLTEQPVPPPEEVNHAVLSTLPPDRLSGPPFVTCKAWQLIDAASGNTIGGHDADRPLDIASTTKLMTAWIILKYADDHPEVLDEQLVMSERADKTVGSTSAVRSGESLPVREALFGLLLPSGNDMSVALAEHFGQRLAESSAGSESDPLLLFVGAMNREARRLGMTKTDYRNPHGLTQDGHRSTCRDLTRLTRAALSNATLRDYVSTRQRGVTVVGDNGYRRNLVWKNTNRLLPTEGYDGVKTGTTTRAGACLISTSTRGDSRLILVVLGSASSASRYTDSRNLYRWGWQQLNVSETTSVESGH